MRAGLFTHADQQAKAAGKYFYPNLDGTLETQTSGSLVRCEYQTMQWESLSELAQWLQQASPDQHLTQGIAQHPQAMVYCRDRAAELGEICPQSGRPIITRTNDDLVLASEPGLMVVDSDSAGQPITMDGVWTALCDAQPQLMSCSCLQTSSSSSRVVLGDTDTGIRGLHTFLHVADSSDIPRALEALHVRMCLAGHSRHKLSRTGQFLPRSYVDQALRVPSQPVYLRAHVVPPVTQDKEIFLRPSLLETVDTRAVVPHLADRERADYARHLAEEQKHLRPEMDRQAETYLTDHSRALAKTQGIPTEEARKVIKSAMQRRLLMPDFVVHTGKHQVTVAEILAEPQRWNGVTCCDPLEPDYQKGKTVAKIYADENGGRIHSFAHSGGDKGTVYPMFNPAELPPVGAVPQVAAADWDNIPLPPIEPDVVAFMGQRPDVSHDTMARELAGVLFSDNARFWTDRGKWLLWDGHKWTLDEKMRSWDAVRVYLRTKAQQVKGWADDNAQYVTDTKAEASLRRWGQQTAHNLRQHTTVAAVHQMLQWSAGLTVVAEELDADLMLLGTPEGTVDLQTGKLRPSKRSDLITRRSAVAPAPSETRAPLWEAFLLKVMGEDAEMVSFLQRAIGYALTGSVSEQKFLFMTGGGRNGKGVFLNTVLGVMGDYARKAPANLFIETRNQEHATGIAGLKGMRFVFGSEIPSGAFWNETALKDMTGGDVLTARFMRGDYFDFMPQFLLAIAANSKPALRDTSQAIRDRILLVPFDVYIAPAKRDPDLADKLRDEWPAILRWAIDGCVQWQKSGLMPPAKVLDASKDYVDREDFLGQFIDDACDAGSDATVSAEIFTDQYNSWRRRNGLRDVPRIQVRKEMEQRGYQYARQRLNGNRPWVFKGLEMRVGCASIFEPMQSPRPPRHELAKHDGAPK